MQVSSLLSTDMFLPTECDVQRSVKRSLPPETLTVIAAVAAAIASSLIHDFCRPGSCAEKRSAVVVESVADERLFMRGEIVTENCDVIKFILDFIKIRFDFWTAFCVSAKFGSYAARNMFP